jgi:hypothetical protein
MVETFKLNAEASEEQYLLYYAILTIPNAKNAYTSWKKKQWKQNYLDRLDKPC